MQVGGRGGGGHGRAGAGRGTAGAVAWRESRAACSVSRAFVSGLRSVHRPSTRGDQATGGYRPRMPSDDEFPPLPGWRWQGAPVRYPDPAVRTLDPRFEDAAGRQRGRRAAGDRLPLGRGAGVVRRPRLPRVERHPEQPDAALGREERRGHDVPQPVALRERQHARSRGPARDLRALDAARDADGARRQRHRADGRLRGQEAQRAQRRRGRARTAPCGSPIPATASLSDYEGERGEHELETAVYLLDPGERRRPGGDHRAGAAERPLLLARRVDAVRRQLRRRRHDQRLPGRPRRHRQPRPRLRRPEARRPGRHPLRRARQRLGGGVGRRRRLRRRPRLRARRHPHRPDRAARGVRQPDLRRPPRHAPLHDRQPVGLQRRTSRVRGLG